MFSSLAWRFPHLELLNAFLISKKFRRCHIFLIPLIPNISQYDLTLPAKQIQIIRNSTWLPKMSVLKLEWFLPCLTYQMPSEIRVGKSWKLASLFYALKSESDEIVMPWFTMHNCLCLKSKFIIYNNYIKVPQLYMAK